MKVNDELNYMKPDLELGMVLVENLAAEWVSGTGA